MFGYVTANTKELTKDQRQRYNAIYCGICRRIRANASQAARLGLSFDMAFLALLLMSLYEPEETSGDRACAIHPLQKRAWVDNEYVSYAADMNVALAYFKANDDIADDSKVSAKILSGIFGKNLPPIREKYPRQCDAMERCIRELTALERENCGNPDLPAGCFGQLMGELLVYREDFWAPTLRELGQDRIQPFQLLAKNRRMMLQLQGVIPGLVDHRLLTDQNLHAILRSDFLSQGFAGLQARRIRILRRISGTGIDGFIDAHRKDSFSSVRPGSAQSRAGNAP